MIKLTTLNYDGAIWVNTALITSFEKHEGGTVIYFDQNNDVKVKETPDQLSALCPPPRS